MEPMRSIPARGGLDYDETPFLVIWEVTQACDLACKHCRASAQPLAHPDELTNAEGKALIDQIAAMGVPIFVFTGGDPLKRQDVFELIRYAAGKGLHVALTPSATPLLTREAIFQFKEAGLVRLGISLDGSTPEIHDSLRGLTGAWERTIQAIGWANEAGIPIQVHTTLGRGNVQDLDSLCALFETQPIVMWNVFFLVPVGRGQLDDLLSGEEFEQAFAKIYELSQRVNFQIKTTEAMHYRRYLLQHNLEERRFGHGHPPTKGTGFSPYITQADSTGALAPEGGSPVAQQSAYEAGAPHHRRPDPHRQLDHPPRQRRQGLPLHLPHGQRLPQRLSAYRCRQCAPDAAGRDLPQRPHLPIPARHRPAQRQVRRLRVQRDLRRLPRPRLCRHRRPPRLRALLHLPAEKMEPAAVE
jgi:MoaA/NifB/PqqE/SkfB family radical SAM enzyme